MLEEVVAPALLPVPSKWVRCGREVDAVLPVLDDWDDNEGDKEGRAAAPLADIYWVRWMDDADGTGYQSKSRRCCLLLCDGGREGGREEEEKGVPCIPGQAPRREWAGDRDGHCFLLGEVVWYADTEWSNTIHMSTLYTQLQIQCCAASLVHHRPGGHHAPR